MSSFVRNLTLAAVTTAALIAAVPALAHCDAVDGPVVVEARAALDKGDVTPLLKWVTPADEAAIRAAFDRTRAVRGKGSDARELADTYFLETLVRIHRASEGEPFTGLKPAGQDLGPAIHGGDHALETGSVDELEALLVEAVREGVRSKFKAAIESRKHAAHSTEAGRRWVHDYASFLHYADGIHRAAGAGSHSGQAQASAGEQAPQKHEH